MEKINLTAKEVTILEATNAFMNYDNAREEKRDNVILFSVAELAKAAEIEPKSARGILNSLVNKGLVVTSEDGFGLTDEGIDEAYRIGMDPETAVEAAEVDQEKAEAEAIEGLVSALTERLGRLSKCQALRETAKSFTGSRSVFIKAAETAGINTGTAARQWQEARGKEPAPANEDDKAALIAHLVENMAADELAEMLVAKMSRAEVKKALETAIAE